MRTVSRGKLVSDHLLNMFASNHVISCDLVFQTIISWSVWEPHYAIPFLKGRLENVMLTIISPTSFDNPHDSLDESWKQKQRYIHIHKNKHKISKSKNIYITLIDYL